MKLISEYYGVLRTSKVFYDPDHATYVTFCYSEDELVITSTHPRLDPAQDLADDWVR